MRVSGDAFGGSKPQDCAISGFLPETEGKDTGWRPEPESNRRARICSPLRNHSAIGPPSAHVRGGLPSVNRRRSRAPRQLSPCQAELTLGLFASGR